MLLFIEVMGQSGTGWVMIRVANYREHYSTQKTQHIGIGWGIGYRSKEGQRSQKIKNLAM